MKKRKRKQNIFQKLDDDLIKRGISPYSIEGVIWKRDHPEYLERLLK